MLVGSAREREMYIYEAGRNIRRADGGGGGWALYGRLFDIKRHTLLDRAKYKVREAMTTTPPPL